METERCTGARARVTPSIVVAGRGGYRVAMEYVNPLTGGHLLPTLGCGLQLIRPGVHTRSHRHTSSVVYQVFRGRGYSIVDGERLDWAEGDFFAVPPYAWHEHHNPSKSDEVVLFSTNDIPVLEALNLYDNRALSEAAELTVRGRFGRRVLFELFDPAVDARLGDLV